MRLLAAALLASLPAAAGAVALQKAPVVKGGPFPSAADCPRTTSYHAFDASKPVNPRKLGELPPANAYAAVLRHDGRCEVPVVIKYGVGRSR
jgi:hypothetical protein